MVAAFTQPTVAHQDALAGDVAIRRAQRDAAILGQDEPPRRWEPGRRLALEHVGHHGARRVARYASDLGQVAKYGRKRHPAPWLWLIYCGRHRRHPACRSLLASVGGVMAAGRGDLNSLLAANCAGMQMLARQCSAPSRYGRRSGSTVAVAELKATQSSMRW